jgi:serine/threonine protein kinase, bacterial
VLPFTGLDGPRGVAVDSTGTLYVTDVYNNRVLKLPVQ